MALTVTATQTTQITLKPQVKKRLLQELRTYAELKAQADAIRSAMDKHKGVIEELRETTGENALSVEGFKITYVTPVRSTLDKKKLVEQGVSMAQIENATVTKTTRPYTKVTCPGEKEEQE